MESAEIITRVSGMESSETTMLHAWQLWFGPALAARGQSPEWPPPDDIWTAQAVWADLNAPPHVQFNEDTQPLYARFRTDRPVERGEKVLIDPEKIVETYLENGRAHVTLRRTPKGGWHLFWNLVWNLMQDIKLAGNLVSWLLGPQARRILRAKANEIGTDYDSLCAGALALVLLERGRLSDSQRALRQVIEDDLWGTGIHSRRSKWTFAPLLDPDAVVEWEIEFEEIDAVRRLAEEFQETEAWEWLMEGKSQKVISEEKSVSQKTISMLIKSQIETMRMRLSET